MYWTLLLAVTGVAAAAHIIQPHSEKFLLAAYDEDYGYNLHHETQYLNAPIQRIDHHLTKLFIPQCFDNNSSSTSISSKYIEGRILINGSYKVENLESEGLQFIRVDKRTNRLKACPKGDLSTGFSLFRDELLYNKVGKWSLCFDDECNCSYIYHGSIKDNVKYCDTNDQEITVKALGKYDASGAIPDYPFSLIED
ncbi:hypothetical protein CANMA_003428 [Candida margitis]|uniref:uncharacterized protein n=1 Tax=Candida margitis TaxID=1775924 RepID=UPI002225E0BE|nr:uncharacterized protein CANMA_003428 [Candida margitis]KAI5964918.1 hypothetical protein CANMA_003428 [Candida margitis]